MAVLALSGGWQIIPRLAANRGAHPSPAEAEPHPAVEDEAIDRCPGIYRPRTCRCPAWQERIVLRLPNIEQVFGIEEQAHVIQHLSAISALSFP